jgi:riboflavin biosynthesis pyrimidine reductase
MRYMEDELARRWVLESIVEAGGFLLVGTLIEHGLVDEFRLMIDPVVLGSGKRIFRDDGLPRPLRLVDGQVASTGAILATYAAAA